MGEYSMNMKSLQNVPMRISTSTQTISVHNLL